jgi:hypothetical protein
MPACLQPRWVRVTTHQRPRWRRGSAQRRIAHMLPQTAIARTPTFGRCAAVAVAAAQRRLRGIPKRRAGTSTNRPSRSKRRSAGIRLPPVARRLIAHVQRKDNALHGQLGQIGLCEGSPAARRVLAGRGGSGSDQVPCGGAAVPRAACAHRLRGALPHSRPARTARGLSSGDPPGRRAHQSAERAWCASVAHADGGFYNVIM